MGQLRWIYHTKPRNSALMGIDIVVSKHVLSHDATYAKLLVNLGSIHNEVSWFQLVHKSVEHASCYWPRTGLILGIELGY